MKLSDIMSAAGLSIYAQIALVLFLAAFLAIMIRTFAPSRSGEMEAASRIPLDDDVVITPRLPEH
jgi:cbb3-type cytochrome oxidase subunit 3